jgi:hypothetical protein
MAATCPPGVDCTEDIGTSVVATVAPIVALTILSVIARFYSRHLTGHRWTLSDWTIVPGLIVSLALSAICLYGESRKFFVNQRKRSWASKADSTQVPRLGLGKHVQVVPTSDLQSLLLSLWLGQIFYAVALTIIKISILLLYISLFPTEGIRLAARIIGALCLAWGIETALVGIFSCNPVRAFWITTIENKICINTSMWFIVNSSMGALLDVVILVLPIRKVWGLRMSLRQKVVVSGMFLLGGL